MNNKSDFSMKIFLSQLIICGLSSLLLANCSVLTKSQVKQVNLFAKATSAYSQYPSKIIDTYAELKYNVDLVDIGVQNQDKIDLIAIAQQERERKQLLLTQSQRLDLSIKIMQTYATALEALSADSYSTDVDKNADLLGDNLDKLVTQYNSKFNGSLPTGIGALVTKTVATAGNGIVRKKQADALKQCVAKATPLVTAVVNNIKEPLQTILIQQAIPELNELLAIQSGRVLKTFLSVKRERLSKTDTLAGSVERNLMLQNRAYFASTFDREIIKLANDIEVMRRQTQQLYETIGGITKAQEAIQRETASKKTLRENITEIKDLYSSLNAIRTLYKAVE